MAATDVVISVGQMKAFLAEGLTRKEIAEKLEVPQKVVNQIFQHPDLKAKKRAKLYNVVFVPEAEVTEGDAPQPERAINMAETLEEEAEEVEAEVVQAEAEGEETWS
jgi:DNA-binding transcriptional regulator LsrR (DeoR family)